MLNQDRVKLLYYLGGMKKFDVGKYMFDYMIHIVSNPMARTALPYGGFVCALANKFQVPLSSEMST